MFAIKINIPLPIFLIALTVGGICLMEFSSTLAEQPRQIQPPLPADPNDKTQEKGSEDKQAAKPIESAPFGFVYDFGKVPRGTAFKHSFRIVNTSNVPLRIISFLGWG